MDRAPHAWLSPHISETTQEPVSLVVLSGEDNWKQSRAGNPKSPLADGHESSPLPEDGHWAPKSQTPRWRPRSAAQALGGGSAWGLLRV